MTGVRIKRIQEYVGPETFLMIYGDNAVKSFREKSLSDGAPITAGYMVLNSSIQVLL